MRRLGVCLSLVVSVALGACGGFDEDASDATPTSDADAGSDGAPPPPVSGDAGEFVVTVAAGQLRIVQGKSADLEVTIARNAGFTGAIEVSLEAAGLTAPVLTIDGGQTKGTLQVSAGADTTQGRVADARVSAVAPATKRKGSVVLDAFVRGAPGAVDTTYGDNGAAALSATNTGNARAATVDTKGRAYVAGSMIERFDENGKLDGTFTADTGGLGVAALAWGNNRLHVCGQASSKLGIVRLLDAGSVDGVYGTGGFSGQTGGFALDPFLTACVVDGASTMFASTGSSNDETATFENRVFWRDQTGASSRNGYSNPSESIRAGAFLGNALYAVGQNPNTLAENLVKFTAGGLYDTAWGKSARVALSSRFTEVVRTPDDKLLLLGPDAFVRYTSAGGIDTTFNSPKPAPFSSGNSSGSRLVVQPDGKLLGLHWDALGGGQCLVARHEANGALDSTFGDSGKTVIPGPCNARAIGLQADGRIVIAGSPSRRIWN